MSRTSASLRLALTCVPSARMRSAPYAVFTTRSRPTPRCTTIAPICPSGAGSTAKSSGAVAEHVQPAASAASRMARNLKACLVARRVSRVVDLRRELGAAHAHDRRRGADLHRLRRLLHHFPGDGREAALLQVAFELAHVRRGVEAVLVDCEHAVRADRDEAVVGEGHARRAVGAGDDHIRGLHRRADRRRELLAPALDLHTALRNLDAAYISRHCRTRYRQGRRHDPYVAHDHLLRKPAERLALSRPSNAKIRRGLPVNLVPTTLGMIPL